MNEAIILHQVSKSFASGRDRRIVLHDLSLAIGKGDVFGFLGPNGAGKSTTIKLLLNFTSPDTGTMLVMGNRVGQEEYRHLIGYLPEFPCFYEHLTARETLLFSGRLSGMAEDLLPARISLLLDRMNLAAASDQRVGSFSKGMKQRLGMANALIHDPEILVLDEPMSGLDPVGRHLIKKIIAELRGQGKTIFFSSHILSDIEDLCNRIGVIHRGNLLYHGALPDFLANDRLEPRFIQVIEEWDRAHGLGSIPTSGISET